jgi:hypothetical protein
MSLLDDLRFAVRLQIKDRWFPRDPVTIGSIAALMITVSIAACVWPAQCDTPRSGQRPAVRVSAGLT